MNENQSLLHVNLPFITEEDLDGQADGDLDFIRKLRDGSLRVKLQQYSQIKDLLQLTQIYDLRVKVTIPVGPDTCKRKVFHGDLRTMEESEILGNMKDQDGVDVDCMTQKDGNVRRKTFTLNKIPEYVNVG